jgi:hypothetical protein
MEASYDAGDPSFALGLAIFMKKSTPSVAKKQQQALVHCGASILVGFTLRLG